MSSTTMCGHLTTLIRMHMVYVYVAVQSAPAIAPVMLFSAELSRNKTSRSSSGVLVQLNSFVTKSSPCFLKKQHWLYDSNTTMNQISRIFAKKKKTGQIWDDGLWKNHNLKTGEIRGSRGRGVDLTSSFLKILYIFWRDSLLNVFLFFVFVYCFFLFLKRSFTRCSPPWKQNEGHSQRSNCRKKTSQSCSVLLSLLKVHVIASECVWVSVCTHTSRCNMELLSANEGAFRLPVFLVLKKKKKRSPCSILAHLLLHPASLPFHI